MLNLFQGMRIPQSITFRIWVGLAAFGLMILVLIWTPWPWL